LHAAPRVAKALAHCVARVPTAIMLAEIDGGSI